MLLKVKARFGKKSFCTFLSFVFLSNSFWLDASTAAEISHKFSIVKILPSKTLLSPEEELSVTLGLDSITTPSFNTSYNRCIMRPKMDSDFIDEFGTYENFNTPNLRFALDFVIEFMQNNKTISGPHFMSLAMLHNGDIVEGKQDGSDMQIISIQDPLDETRSFSTLLERNGTISVKIRNRNAASYPINFIVPGTGDVIAQYYLIISQYQTSDMSTQAKKDQNYKCGGYTNTQELFTTGKQVVVLSSAVKQPQSISSFYLPKTSAINLQALQLKAASNTGSPVQFLSLTPNVCLVNNQILILRNTGKCKVQASAAETSKFQGSANLVKEVLIVPKGVKYEAICVKGKTVKSVVGVNPKCPKGYAQI